MGGIRGFILGSGGCGWWWKCDRESANTRGGAFDGFHLRQGDRVYGGGPDLEDDAGAGEGDVWKVFGDGEGGEMKEEHKPSPGPWKIVRSELYQESGGGEGRISIIAADGTTVACNQTYYPTALEPRNAAVIAAAPEMLEALKALLGRFEEHWIYAHEEIDFSQDLEVVAARKAIRKAEGK